MKQLLTRLRQLLTFKPILFSALALILMGYIIAVYWSIEPDDIDIQQRVNADAQQHNHEIVTGYTTTSTVIYLSQTLLEKPGGFLSNDVMPPSLFMDNMPAWEYGVLLMLRDMSLAMRDGFSRSQSQSIDNENLQQAQSKLNIAHHSWLFPSAESSYQDAITALYQYRESLSNKENSSAQFYARADNLAEWIQLIGKRLGNYSQRLSASVGQERLNTALAGDLAARQSTQSPAQDEIKTSWWLIDDEFYEARGASWALIHLLKAIEYDFASVLTKKNATVSLQQIIRELEATQDTLWSPMILNGGGFGIVANHSLVMANYISRANAALIDLKELLTKG